MTRNEILALPAGPALDALVVERVMGWRNVKWERQPFPLLKFQTEEDAWDYWGTYTTVPPSEMRGKVPVFSMDPAEAWRVVEKMLTDYFDWYELSRWGAPPGHRCGFGGSVRNLVYALTMPEAVCKAALLALENQS